MFSGGGGGGGERARAEGGAWRVAACFILCHGAFSAALRLSMIYCPTAASSLHGRSVCMCVCVCVITQIEIDSVRDI